MTHTFNKFQTRLIFQTCGPSIPLDFCPLFLWGQLPSSAVIQSFHVWWPTKSINFRLEWYFRHPGLLFCEGSFPPPRQWFRAFTGAPASPAVSFGAGAALVSTSQLPPTYLPSSCCQSYITSIFLSWISLYTKTCWFLLLGSNCKNCWPLFLSGHQGPAGLWRGGWCGSIIEVFVFVFVCKYFWPFFQRAFVCLFVCLNGQLER